jgi:hypothetical protein
MLERSEESASPPVLELQSGVPFPHTSFKVLFNSSLVAARRPVCSLADHSWARSVLLPHEYELWTKLSEYEKCHAVSTARELERRLARTPESWDPTWLAAALLHDVGKMDANLSMTERGFASLLGMYVKTSTARRWLATSGMVRRIGLFLFHGESGARLVREVGGREVIAVWCETHHGNEFPPDFAIPPQIVAALIASEH